MTSIEPNPYEYHIAKAAREYIEEVIAQEKGMTNKDTKALLKLRWLILAEENGWNPNAYSEAPLIKTERIEE